MSFSLIHIPIQLGLMGPGCWEGRDFTGSLKDAGCLIQECSGSLAPGRLRWFSAVGRQEREGAGWRVLQEVWGQAWGGRRIFGPHPGGQNSGSRTHLIGGDLENVVEPRTPNRKETGLVNTWH